MCVCVCVCARAHVRATGRDLDLKDLRSVEGKKIKKKGRDLDLKHLLRGGEHVLDPILRVHMCMCGCMSYV